MSEYEKTLPNFRIMSHIREQLKLILSHGVPSCDNGLIFEVRPRRIASMQSTLVVEITSMFSLLCHFFPVMLQVQQKDPTLYGVASSPSWEIHIFAFFTFPIAIHSRFWPLTASHCCCINCCWIPVLLTYNHL